MRVRMTAAVARLSVIAVAGGGIGTRRQFLGRFARHQTCAQRCADRVDTGDATSGVSHAYSRGVEHIVQAAPVGREPALRAYAC